MKKGLFALSILVIFFLLEPITVSSGNLNFHEELKFSMPVEEFHSEVNRLFNNLKDMGVLISEEEMYEVVLASMRTEDPELYLAQAFKESSLRKDSVSDNGESFGLFSIQDKHWGEFLRKKGIIDSSEDYFIPEKAFLSAEAIVTHLEKRFGDEDKALLYFNGGRLGVKGKIRSTNRYLKEVRLFQQTLKL